MFILVSQHKPHRRRKYQVLGNGGNDLYKPYSFGTRAFRNSKDDAGSLQVVKIINTRSINAVIDGDFSLQAGSAGNNPPS
jgi:hypothetical protein